PHRALRAAARGRLEGADRFHPPGGLRPVPEGPPQRGRGRVLPLRSADDADRRPGHALRPRRREGADRLRRLRLVSPVRDAAPAVRRSGGRVAVWVLVTALAASCRGKPPGETVLTGTAM